MELSFWMHAMKYRGESAWPHRQTGYLQACLTQTKTSLHRQPEENYNCCELYTWDARFWTRLFFKQSKQQPVMLHALGAVRVHGPAHTRITHHPPHTTHHTSHTRHHTLYTIHHTPHTARNTQHATQHRQ